MLDIKFIRENPELVQKAADRKGILVPVGKLLDLDREAARLLQELEVLREKRNNHTAEIKGKPTEDQIHQGRLIKEEVEKKGIESMIAVERLNEQMLEVPALPLDDVPDEDKELRKVGKIPEFSFPIKDHLEIGEDLEIIDVDRAAKVSGSRFGYIKNEGALLEFALVQYAMEIMLKEGFRPVVPPVLIKKEITDRLGYWNGGGNEDYYLVVEPGDKEGQIGEELFYLVGTAEHSLVPMHKDEILNKKDLPMRYVGFSSAFRREAGTYGKDTRGILRVHQFDKVEMISLVAEGEEEKEHQFLLNIEEMLFQGLGIPYHVLAINARDLGFPITKKYDLEAWIPSQNKYREMTSVSRTGEFQSRRLNIRYQDGEQNKYVSILNGTGFAIGRTIIAILENYQQEDGSVVIPEVLRKYMGGIEVINSKAK